jgi:type II secretory pathway pseudopilin PulG
MKPIHHPAHKRPSSGFTLTEVIIALGLFIFAITALMGVIPYGMNQVQTASNESRSLAALEAMRDDIKLGLKLQSNETLIYEIGLPNGSNNVTIDQRISETGARATASQAALFRVQGSLTRPAAASADPIHLNLRATWPANAPIGKETGSVDLVAAFKP